MTPKKLLFSLAHPDDESFGSGALIAKYVHAGVEVSYICATDGARGTIAKEFLDKYGSPSAVRYAELDCAAHILGFKQVYKLGYGDSGMMGTPENHDPHCLWQADENEVTGKIVAILREVQPQVVVTFDPYGGYGHPDHIFVHRVTTRAFYAASDPAQFPESGSPYQPHKLYYTSFSHNLLRYYIWMTRLSGQNPRKLGVNKDFDLLAVAKNLLPVTAKIDIAAWFDDWDRAANCHASQASPRRSVPRFLQRLIAGKQGLTRVYPPRHPHEKIETDLFEGVP